MAGGMPALLSQAPAGLRSCCCPARPAFQVVLPASAGRRGGELLLCAHHYRAGRAELESLGAAVYDATGWPVSLPGWPSPS